MEPMRRPEGEEDSCAEVQRDDPVIGELHREHWRVPVHGLTHADPDGIVQAIARRDGAVDLHLTCGDSRTRVRLDVCRAAQLSTGIWEAAGAAQQFTASLGDDQPLPPSGSEDLPQAWRAHPHRNTPPRHRSPRHRRKPAPVNKGAGMDATRMIGLRLRRIRHARDKSLQGHLRTGRDEHLHPVADRTRTT